MSRSFHLREIVQADPAMRDNGGVHAEPFCDVGSTRPDARRSPQKQAEIDDTKGRPAGLQAAIRAQRYPSQLWTCWRCHCGLTMERLLWRMREAGWMVATHNDYIIDATGERRSYWMFTHADGHWVDGEGPYDVDALKQCWEKAVNRFFAVTLTP